mmetsp:Transcript_1358/g.2643  ORF Transcript_1358/g.2643 Transcript_1358/m.2643 type:complete len:261 (+) Transcript_1358:2-784(+)
MANESRENSTSTASTSTIKYLDNFTVGTVYDHLFKCLLLGDSATGKSSLCGRQVERQFDMNQQHILTCGVDFKVQAFEWEGKVVKLQIWDTAGQERFRAIVNSYYRNSSGIMLCYDITDPTTAENVKSWLIEIEKYAPVDVRIVLCGTKFDLQSDPFQSENIRLSREIIDDILKSYPDIKHHCQTSAKTGQGVEDAFLKLVDCMLKHEAQANRLRKTEELDKQFVQQGRGVSNMWNKSWEAAYGLVKKPYSSLMSGGCGS